MNRLRLVSGSLGLVLTASSLAVAAPQAGPAAAGQAAARQRDASRLQMSIMEDALQRAVEAAQGRAVRAIQENAGLPALFTMEGDTRARAFRLDGYGVFFDVDLPPVPRTFAWSVQVLDSGASLAPDVALLKRQVDTLNDPRVKRVLEPIIQRMERATAPARPARVTRAADGQVAVSTEGVVADQQEAAPADPFKDYVDELKRTLVQVMLDYGPTIQLRPDDWLHVAAREMSPKLMPGNPTEATITLRVKASDLAAFKAGRLTPEEAARHIEVREMY